LEFEGETVTPFEGLVVVGASVVVVEVVVVDVVVVDDDVVVLDEVVVDDDEVPPATVLDVVDPLEEPAAAHEPGVSAFTAAAELGAATITSPDESIEMV
jgi:hypothetical protein